MSGLRPFMPKRVLLNSVIKENGRKRIKIYNIFIGLSYDNSKIKSEILRLNAATGDKKNRKETSNKRAIKIIEPVCLKKSFIFKNLFLVIDITI